MTESAVRGRLIAIEGIDGVGKTTQTLRLAAKLGAVETFQFGATSVGARIRPIVLDSSLGVVDARAEALLIMADKAQHVSEKVLPALNRGDDVVTDRYTASALAYQGYGRGLDLGALEGLISFATEDLEADLNILLQLPVDAAIKRLAAKRDRIEQAGRGFLERVNHGYQQLVAANPERWAVVDGLGEVDEVAARILACVKDRWPDVQGSSTGT